MRYITAKECIVIPLGRQGENAAETVQFPVEGWEELYGSGSFELLHKRANDEYPYPCVLGFSEDRNYVEWVVSNADVAYVGRGTAQLIYVVDGAVAKSVIYATSTLQSIDGSGDVPEPYQSWVDEVLRAAETAAEDAEADIAEAEAARVRAENGRVAAEDARVAAENQRVQNENERAQAETGRQDAEAARVRAENGRVNAENERVEEFNEMISVRITTAQINALFA